MAYILVIFYYLFLWHIQGGTSLEYGQGLLSLTYLTRTEHLNSLPVHWRLKHSHSQFSHFQIDLKCNSLLHIPISTSTSNLDYYLSEIWTALQMELIPVF